MPSSEAAVKVIKGGKTNDNPDERKITLRGVEYTIREIDTDEYDDIIKTLEDGTGNVRFDKLLKAMVARCVRPLPNKPFKFPVYKTLEGIVQEMHYTELEDEAKAAEGAEEAAEDAKPPNS